MTKRIRTRSAAAGQQARAPLALCLLAVTALLGMQIALTAAWAEREASSEPAEGSAVAASEADPVPLRASEGRRKQSDRFPNVLLTTHDERQVRFYDDLVKDRTVIVNFMYTTCYNVCLPIAQNLGRVHALFGERMGRDVLLISISIDSEVDDPEALRGYIERNGGEKRGWVYLTGDYDEIDGLRRSLGVYDLDPVIDADKTQHSGLITFGNDRTDLWGALPALMDSGEIVESVVRITRSFSPAPAPGS
ncbi:MAG: SCO family protein [Myxococcales bacterium]|nr:SCO family protein [Myxococcales bacterium]